jgi:hypothetical protein
VRGEAIDAEAAEEAGAGRVRGLGADAALVDAR